MKKNLIVVFYFGNRRRICNNSKLDKFFFLKKQVEFLINYKHDLDQITFVINGDLPSEEKYLKIIEPLKNKCNLSTLKRENIGISYGGFSDAVDKYINEFDFFIFLEDDWVFCYDYFDNYLIRKFLKEKNTSMVCAVSSNTDINSKRIFGNHASVSIYCSSEDKIKELYKIYGKLPYSENGYFNGQVFQTSKFFEIGNVIDITEDFFVRFLDIRGIQSWGNKNNFELVKQLDFI